MSPQPSHARAAERELLMRVGNMDQRNGDRLQRLLDEQEIRAVLMRYARGADRNDVTLLRSVYHPDASDDHGFFRGGVDEFIEWFEKRHRDVVQSMHFLGNCTMEFLSEDVAIVESYIIAFQRMRVHEIESGYVEDRRTLARSIDRFERRDVEWLIAKRLLIYDTAEVKTVPVDAQFPADITLQQHSTEDPSYSFGR
jgi:SnoaL-like domain